mmetsp:Transcript_20785/g.44384  ORF Transcript_20785/g.44384 Transcript_20785/m.44384 type:complete len:528 (+) Transcript_20785:287-1870(+)
MGAASSLQSTVDVRAALEDDKFRVAYKRHEETLERQQHHCCLMGFQSTSPYARPLMKDKLTVTLSHLDDLATSYSADQRRQQGYTQTYAELLTASGPVRSLCSLDDGATVACASSQGPIWVYNWREGREVSRMRCETGPNCPVLQMCKASEDNGLLASGDQHGRLVLWDLRGPSVASEAHLHQQSITGLHWDKSSNAVLTASEDTHLMLYDIASGTVIGRGKPQSLTCGDGVPSTALAVVGEGATRRLLVGGADGKLRCWAQDGSTFNRIHTISCNKTQASKCIMANDGWRLVVATRPADTILCGGDPNSGGLLLFDVRRLSESDESSALVAHCAADRFSNEFSGIQDGVWDMTLMSGKHDSTVALCCMNGVVRAFDINSASEGTLKELVSEWSFDVLGSDTDTFPPAAYPCAITSLNENLVMTASTEPALAVWRRSDNLENIAKSDHQEHRVEPSPWAREPPLVLRSRCSMLRKPQGVRETEFLLPYGTTLCAIKDSLQHDRARHIGFPPRKMPPLRCRCGLGCTF